MWSWTFRSIRRGGLRAALLTVGLLAVTMGGLLVAAASQTTLLTADRELRQYWRGSYDILVRPAGTRSSIEEEYGLVEANHLSGIWGGITFEQYAAIRDMPGMEVVAPIAMIGVVDGWAPSEPLSFEPDPGAYVLEESVTVYDGARSYVSEGYPARSFLYYDPEQPFEPLPYNAILSETGISLVDPSFPRAQGGVLFPFLMAGIDPLQEAALIGLDQSVVQGRYLREQESLDLEVTFEPIDPDRAVSYPTIGLPILINATTYVDLVYSAELGKVRLPADASRLDDIRARGGAGFLETLSSDPFATTEMDSAAIYDRMIQQISNKEMLFGMGRAKSKPGALAYDESQLGPNYSGLRLSLLPVSDGGSHGQVKYRASLPLEETAFKTGYLWNVIGVFDIEHLRAPEDVTRVPLETYFPPVGALIYDKDGHPVDPVRTIRPTLDPEGYMQSPPLVITTLDGARALRGDDAISAIRVRVGGIEDLGPASQRKIEAVAIEIAKSTGLAVDIVVGSSPTRVLVHVPGIGYVEEQWIRKGVNLVYREGIQAGSWLLIGTILVAGALFTLDLTWSEVLAQRRLIALHKALGWRTRTVMAYLTGRLLLVGATAVIVGTAGSWGFTRIMGWQVPALPLLLGLPVLVLTLVCVAGLPLIWKASRVPPLAGIRQAGVRATRGSPLPARSLASYGWSSLMRRPARTLLTATASALSAALLVLLLAVTLGQRGMLSGTLLGEFILVRVQGFHYAIVGIGFALAALSTANGLLGSIVERRHEIGILKAVGWRSLSVARLFVLEGLLVGLAGGLVGALLGCGAGLYLHKALSPAWAAMAAAGMGVAGLVGAVAALYPARLAARVPPAEALRYE